MEIRAARETLTMSADALMASPPIAWNDTYLLGFGVMDNEHRELVSLIGLIQSCPDADLQPNLRRLALHAREHFRVEDAWMQETDFPPRECHMDEHAAVLQSVAAVEVRVGQGDIAEGRRLAQALADWFPGHAQHLDSALSHWMCKRRLGGKPVVLRRSVVPAA